MLKRTPVSFTDNIKDVSTSPLTQPLLGVLIHPLQPLRRFHIYGTGTVQEVPANGIYWTFQPLGTVPGTEISEIPLSCIVSGHHLHKSYCKQVAL